MKNIKFIHKKIKDIKDVLRLIKTREQTTFIQIGNPCSSNQFEFQTSRLKLLEWCLEVDEIEIEKKIKELEKHIPDFVGYKYKSVPSKLPNHIYQAIAYIELLEVVINKR